MCSSDLSEERCLVESGANAPMFSYMSQAVKLPVRNIIKLEPAHGSKHRRRVRVFVCWWSYGLPAGGLFTVCTAPVWRWSLRRCRSDLPSRRGWRSWFGTQPRWFQASVSMSRKLPNLAFWIVYLNCLKSSSCMSMNGMADMVDFSRFENA